MFRIFFPLLISGALFLMSCDSTRVYEDFQQLPKGWAITDTVVFSMPLTQPESENVSLTTQFRCNLDYPYSNLYYRLIIQEGDSSIYNELHQAFFFDKKTGKPFGGGLGDLFTIEDEAYSDFSLSNGDTVSIKLVQYMRLDTLKGIDRVGLRVNTIP